MELPVVITDLHIVNSKSLGTDSDLDCDLGLRLHVDRSSQATE